MHEPHRHRARGEAILANPDKGTKVLAEQADQSGPVTMGTACLELYVNTNDIEGAHQAAVDAGHTSLVAPMRLEQWPMSIAFVADPDGYQVGSASGTRGRTIRTARPPPGSASTASTSATSTPPSPATRPSACRPTSRTEIPQAFEAIVENPEKRSKISFAQQKEQDGPIDMGTAMWKLYVNTDDVEATHAAALDAGFEPHTKPSASIAGRSPSAS